MKEEFQNDQVSVGSWRSRTNFRVLTSEASLMILHFAGLPRAISPSRIWFSRRPPAADLR